MAAALLTSRVVLNRSIMPVIVVCGATGTGKSKLAIEIAQRYGGECISADAMQIYKGLDIVTNKVTEEEKQGVEHHLLDCAGPLDRWTVVDYRRRALPIVDNLLESGRMPIIVGGTLYYIESLLWKTLIDDPVHISSSSDDDSSKSPIQLNEEEDDESLLCRLTFTEEGVSVISSGRLHRLLSRVDPAMADTLHPNNRRKIIRSLQAWQQHGRPHSELLASQRDSSKGGSELGGPLRYPADRTLIFWVQCRQEVLDARLDARLDEMMERGLIQELAQFHADYNQLRLEQSLDYFSTGIFQSIGLKQFDAYLRASEPSSELLAQGLLEMKIANRRYSRYQVKWIKKRFLQQPDRQVPSVYGLDATDPEKWNENVRDVAFKIIDGLDLEGEAKKDVPEPLPFASTSTRVQPKSFHCSICDRIIIGERQWQEHLKSARHRKVVKHASRCALIRKPD